MTAELRPWVVTRPDGQTRILVWIDPAALDDCDVVEALWPGRLFRFTTAAFLLAAIIVVAFLATGRF